MTTETKTLTMTPKRAAQVLVYDWIISGGTSPWYMDEEEMSDRLRQYRYNVTEKRRDQIIEQVDKIIDPLKDKLADRIQEFATV